MAPDQYERVRTWQGPYGFPAGPSRNEAEVDADTREVVCMSEADVMSLARAALVVPFPGSTPPRWLLDELERGLGGVTIFALNGNVPDPEGLAALTTALRNAGDPVITIDEEGGDVTRVAHTTGSPYPGNAALGAVDDPELTLRVHRALGAELAQLGVNLDFAPSADVNTEDDNPVIGTRAFGSDPRLVARHAAAAVTGLQEAGVAACAKHFPGHGATRVDSHHGLPVIDADLELLDRRELVPFRAAIDAGVQAVMTGHLTLPAITGGEPATLSRAAVTGLLRERLGFSGVIITDALDMRGASAEIGIHEASVRSLCAGADLLCLGSQEYEESVRAILTAIVAAVRSGRLPVERLSEAAERTERLKAWLAARTVPGTGSGAGPGAGSGPSPGARPGSDSGAGPGARPGAGSGAGPGAVDPAVGLEAARRAVRLSGELPAPGAPLVVQLEASANIAAGPVPWGLGPWLPAEDVVRIGDSAGAADRAMPTDLLQRASGRPLVIVVRDAHRHSGQREFVSALLAGRPDAVVVEMGLPVWRPASAALIATYGASYASGQAAAELLGLVTR
jgi:beta-N-acetylhexosaminidase